MQKKIFSLLVLLMTAVSGAWADITITWGSAELSSLTDDQLLAGATKTVNGITVTVNAGSNNFLAVSPVGTMFSATNDNAFTFSTELGNFTKIECTSLYLDGTLGDGWDGATWTGDANSVNMSNAGSNLAVSCITFTIGEPAAPAATANYYLVGTMNDWGASKQFLLIQNPSNLDEYMITLTLKAGAELKVIGVGENTTWYPGDGGNYVVTNAGKYTVYFRPDYQGGDGWYCNCIYLKAAPAPAIPVTEAGSNEWTFEMPDYAVVANVEYETELELKEENVNTTVLADWDGYEADVTLKRTLTAGMWNTLALPFSMDIPSGWTVKELSTTTLENGTLTLNFANAQSIVAGTPYLVMVSTTTDLLQVPFSSAIVSKEAVPVETDYVDFIPTLGKTNITGDAESVLFLAAENKLKNPTSLPSDMKGFRAYFLLHDLPTAGARSFSLNLGDKETGIMAIDHSPLNTDQSVYDLQGRRMANGQSSTVDGQSLKKGVYIVNGKKTIIK